MWLLGPDNSENEVVTSQSSRRRLKAQQIFIKPEDNDRY